MTYRHSRRLGIHAGGNSTLEHITHGLELTEALITLVALGHGLVELSAPIWNKLKLTLTYITAGQSLQDTKETLRLLAAGIDVLGRSLSLRVRRLLLVLFGCQFGVLFMQPDCIPRCDHL